MRKAVDGHVTRPSSPTLVLGKYERAPMRSLQYISLWNPFCYTLCSPFYFSSPLLHYLYSMFFGATWISSRALPSQLKCSQQGLLAVVDVPSHTDWYSSRRPRYTTYRRIIFLILFPAFFSIRATGFIPYLRPRCHCLHCLAERFLDRAHSV